MHRKSKFWSCIKKNTDFYDLTREQQIDALINGGVYVCYNSASSSSSSKLIVKDNVLYLPDLSIKKKPSEDLLDEFYDYVLDISQSDIDTHFYLFFKNFNDSVFGMEFLEQKKVARELFIEIYDSVDVKGIDFLKKEFSKNGIENLKEYNRFLKLKSVRKAKCSALATDDSLISFLGGNEAYFKSSEFLEHNNFLSMLDFEKQLKVLISLNDRYQFTEDVVFSKLGKLKDRYKKYQNTFSSFDVFRFTNNFIEELNENKPSNIDSLHQALLELNLIQAKKESFINYLNTEHNTPTTKLRNYARDVNRSHDFRVLKIKEQLKELIS
ncbi:hypothetical protein H9W90_10550 [Polaribacter pectinis]|uniref:Uncharacterized protein n=1 Tax=Polaribacter pectinis TaxID=2738844 RepID=A0A7G9L7N7_9FLAO|nr:hypothetical protein [Polaribacter pectinis]QNM84574.1 hypothetical protein H9W90_10235 [Polaribacter pectinis]QNM84636.1 hypothetical protein H9W90_10550 [Polaribacter pectinis]